MLFYFYVFNWVKFFYFFFFLIFFSVLLISLNFFICYKFYTYEKATAFECGFEPFLDARQSFSLHFYIVGLIFLLFDIELIFLIPFNYFLVYLNWNSIFIFNFFLFCILYSLIYELYYKVIII